MLNTPLIYATYYYDDDYAMLRIINIYYAAEHAVTPFNTTCAYAARDDESAIRHTTRDAR